MPSEEAVQQLVEQHVGMVKRMVRRIGRGYNDIDELIGYAFEGLVKAAKKWSSESNMPFAVYLCKYLAPKIRRYRHKRNAESWRTLSLDHSWLANIPDEHDLIEDACDRVWCQSLFRTLTPREREVINIRYSSTVHTDKDAAKVLGVTQQLVAKLRNRALVKMRAVAVT